LLPSESGLGDRFSPFDTVAIRYIGGGCPSPFLTSAMAKPAPAALKSVTVSLPYGIGSASWEADPTEQYAAWELYIELVSRVAVQSLSAEQGTVREAMNSLYSLFGSTREILRKAGPKVGASHESVGGIAQ
jgi:hypothetical protein